MVWKNQTFLHKYMKKSWSCHFGPVSIPAIARDDGAVTNDFGIRESLDKRKDHSNLP